MAPKVQPMVISPSYTQTTPPSSFAEPDRGTLTWHTIFSSPQTPTDALCCGVAHCRPGDGILHHHRHTQAEIYHITEGKGVVYIEGKEYDVEAGSSVFIPGDAEHGIRAVAEEGVRWFYVFPGGAFGDVHYRFTHEEKKGQGVGS